jgi:hypothetical protein
VPQGTVRTTLLCGSLCALLACEEPPFDTTRKIDERGTLGEEMFKLYHRDLEREDPRRAEGFESERGGFVEAIDHLFPDAELASTQEFLLRLLPLYDDQTIPTVTRRLAEVSERLDQDREALAALAALEARRGYVSVEHQQALERRIANYPRFRELSKSLLRFALAHDGLDANGNESKTEDDVLRRLMKSVSKGLSEIEISADAERDIVLFADLLLSEDARLSIGPSPSPSGPSSVVSRDARGMAKVVLSPQRTMPSPFVDQSPADGLADLDGSGRFVDANGKVIDLQPFGRGGERDVLGRAVIAPGGPPVYQYVDLDETLLAGLSRDTRTLIERDVPKKALTVLRAILGERGEDGKYLAEGNKLLDLTYALGEAIDMNELPDLLELGADLVDQHEGTVAYLALQAERQLEVADRHTVALKQGNTFFNDIMSVIRKILIEPGLAEDLLDALEDPAVLRLPQAAATLSEFATTDITEADFLAGNVFTQRVDRSRPDVRGNQSLHQRVLHLMYDTKGARYEPRFIGVPLGFIFQIEDQAEFYMLSIIGEAEIPSLVSQLTGLSTKPTPDELSVFLNAEQRFGNPTGNEGLDVKANDGDTLFAASASGMVDGLRPLIRVFYDHGKLDLVFELFAVLHLHWASVEGGDYQDQSRGEPRYSKLSGIRRYEPLLIDVFRDTHELDAIRKLLSETRGLRTSSGKSVRDVLLAFARKLLLKNTDLRTRSGAREVFVDAERVTSLSPFDLIRSARADLKIIMRRSGETQAAWDTVIDELHELFLATETAGPEAGRFKNARLKPVARTLLDFFADRATAHKRAGDLRGWPRRALVENLGEVITSEDLPALLDVHDLIEADPALDQMITELRDQLLAEDQGFPELLAIAGDQLQAAKDASIAVPFLRFMGREIDPDSKLTFLLLDLMDKTLVADPEEKILEVSRRAIEKRPSGGLYFEGITAAIRQTNRVNVSDHGLLDAADLEKILGKVSSYMTDDEHGLEKFYELVKGR